MSTTQTELDRVIASEVPMNPTDVLKAIGLERGVVDAALRSGEFDTQDGRDLGLESPIYLCELLEFATKRAVRLNWDWAARYA